MHACVRVSARVHVVWVFVLLETCTAVETEDSPYDEFLRFYCLPCGTTCKFEILKKTDLYSPCVISEADREGCGDGRLEQKE